MSDSHFYIKEGRKFKKVFETPRLYSDGVWLVQTTEYGKSSQCILKLGELKELYPYAQMAADIDDLASFIVSSCLNRELKTLTKNADGSYTYTYGSGAEQAKEILKFLSLSKDQRKKENERLSSENAEWWDLKYGKLNNGWNIPKKAILERIKKLEEEKAALEKLLK